MSAGRMTWSRTRRRELNGIATTVVAHAALGLAQRLQRWFGQFVRHEQVEDQNVRVSDDPHA